MRSRKTLKRCSNCEHMLSLVIRWCIRIPYIVLTGTPPRFRVAMRLGRAWARVVAAAQVRALVPGPVPAVRVAATNVRNIASGIRMHRVHCAKTPTLVGVGKTAKPVLDATPVKPLRIRAVLSATVSARAARAARAVRVVRVVRVVAVPAAPVIQPAPAVPAVRAAVLLVPPAAEEMRGPTRLCGRTEMYRLPGPES